MHLKCIFINYFIVTFEFITYDSTKRKTSLHDRWDTWEYRRFSKLKVLGTRSNVYGVFVPVNKLTT